MITYTTNYNTAVIQNSLMSSIYCIVRGENEEGIFETVGGTVFFDPPVLIDNFDLLTKEQMDSIVQPHQQYSDLQQKVSDGILARSSIVIKELPWNIIPEPPPPEINPVPQGVTPLQIRAAINLLGIREYVDTYVATLDQTSKDAWEYATVIERNNSILVNGAIYLGKTEEDLDNLFILAATLI